MPTARHGLGSRQEGFLLTLRRWFVIPVAMAVLGAALAALVGTRAQPTAELLLSLQTSNPDTQTQDRQITSAIQAVSTRSVFEAAARSTGTNPTDLRQRTRITAVSNSLVLAVNVTAATSAQAVREAKAIAAAALQQDQNRTNEALRRLRNDTVKLMTDPSSQVGNKSAERARVQRLGDELAGNQSNLVSGNGTLSVLEDAEPTNGLTSPLVLGALGAAGGGVLGLALALFIGFRRGKVGSVRELRRLYPDLPVLEPNELGALLLIEAASMSTIIIAGVRNSPKMLQEVAGVVGERLAQAGREVTLVDGAVAPAPVPGRGGPGSGYTLTRDMTVLTSPLNRSLVRQAARDTSTMLIIVIEPQATRLDWLEEYAGTGFGDRTYLLLHQRLPQWES